jgi:hypothetical protein
LLFGDAFNLRSIKIQNLKLDLETNLNFSNDLNFKFEKLEFEKFKILKT